LHRAADAVRRSSLPCLWIFLLWGPGETEASVEETLLFVDTQVRPQDPVFFTTGIRIYPRTAIRDTAEVEGFIGESTNLLEPVFYLSPELDPKALSARIANFASDHMNVILIESPAMSALPALQRLAGGLGIRPPLWRYTTLIRRALSWIGQ
jgi:hypothetical protein